MAEALLSTAITARNAIQAGSGASMTSKTLNGATMKVSRGVFEVSASASTVGSTYRVCSVPATAVIDRITVKCDAALTTGTIDIGLYKTTAMGGAAVDADVYATAYDVSGAGLVDQVEINLKWEILDFGANFEKQVWQDGAVASLAVADAMYDVVATTATGTFGGGGSLAITVYYLDGD